MYRTILHCLLWLCFVNVLVGLNGSRPSSRLVVLSYWLRVKIWPLSEMTKGILRIILVNLSVVGLVLLRFHYHHHSCLGSKFYCIVMQTNQCLKFWVYDKMWGGICIIDIIVPTPNSGGGLVCLPLPVIYAHGCGSSHLSPSSPPLSSLLLPLSPCKVLSFI